MKRVFRTHLGKMADQLDALRTAAQEEEKHESAQKNIQFLDTDGHFNPNIADALAQWGVLSRGLDYSLVSVLGAQSSGKSTVLNGLFGTRFSTMNAELGRSQTTVGAWLGKATTLEGPPHEPTALPPPPGTPASGCPPRTPRTPTSVLSVESPGKQQDSRLVLVLDCEGTDSRERGEDANQFERKYALFALSLAEVLIVNLWEHDVGRHAAANYGLLRVVFEANLRLCQYPGAPKTLMLFLFRDHVKAPMDRLEAILREDMNKIWADIAKVRIAIVMISLPPPLVVADTHFGVLKELDLQGLFGWLNQSELYGRCISPLDHKAYHPLMPLFGSLTRSVWSSMAGIFDGIEKQSQEFFRSDPIIFRVRSSFFTTHTPPHPQPDNFIMGLSVSHYFFGTPPIIFPTRRSPQKPLRTFSNPHRALLYLMALIADPVCGQGNIHSATPCRVFFINSI
ncbi:putative root hair defective 3 gtp-binding protein [Paratrimastix pyriformis]|uniref:Root hair defective 3 gtp-binding protein n=1 Tax=Paratrimastix pyriformis TaxID=342808 RepID=A0ABQ8UDQ5_9EUKA|nr:putative root hair defective 3 gtp-binding protein [Paratrimastix pyriformis]